MKVFDIEAMFNVTLYCMYVIGLYRLYGLKPECLLLFRPTLKNRGRGGGGACCLAVDSL